VNQSEQHDLVRDRFTRTAEIFGSSVLKTRAAEAEILARMAQVKASDRAVDFACGTGALAMAFAPRVQWVFGVDLTAAMLAVAQRDARETKVQNVAFTIGNAQKVPFADGSFDLALTSYALHHVPDAAQVISEMRRVLKPGGRVGVIDIYAPEERHRAEMHERIERVRDPSHTRTLARSELRALFAEKGFRVVDMRTEENALTFDRWMHTAGRAPGDPEYIESRRLMEQTIADDLAGFRPRYNDSVAPGENGAREIEMINPVVIVAAEKI
jgi:ubiquinone/menaquinone biosynthesis C-methylase UbiE